MISSAFRGLGFKLRTLNSELITILDSCRLFQFSGSMGVLPCKSTLIPTEMAITGRLFVNRFEKIEVFNNGPWPQVENFPDDLCNLIRGNL